MSGRKEGWLVIGGAGYIGSHIARNLKKNGFETIVLDDLSLGKKERVPKNIKLIIEDCKNSESLNKILINNRIIGVIHLAALKQARESLRLPLRYYDENLTNMLSILRAIKNSPVKYVVFSSSCSIYGASSKVSELSETKPISPYGRSKLFCEKILQDCANSLNISFISLRYFNVIGNDNFPFAFDTSNECLIPSLYSKISSGKLPEIYGTNFLTPDGTNLRDYIDVRDLAEIHFLAANFLISNKEKLSLDLNVGTGEPISVLQILNKICIALDLKEDFEDLGRNPADPPAIWANINKFKKLFNWEPKYSLEDSINSYIESTSKKDEF